MSLGEQGKFKRAIKAMEKYERLKVKPDPPSAVVAMWHMMLGDVKGRQRWLDCKEPDAMAFKIEYKTYS